MNNTYNYRAGGRKAQNNGQNFEELIDRALIRYRALKWAYIEKTPEPMRPLHSPNARGQFLACYTKQAQPDYKGTMKGGYSIVFEAKHTEGNAIQQNRVSEQQAAALDQHYALGAYCFVLVSFRFEKYYLIPWAVWKDMPRQFGKVSANENDLLPYSVFNISQFLDGIIKSIEVIEELEKREMAAVRNGECPLH